MNDTPRFPPEKLLRYPHMFPNDIAIWERFIEKYAAGYSGFDYDVKVGTGTAALPHVGAAYRQMQETLSKYRIDVVGRASLGYIIFEVKPDAAASAIGQVLTYTTLFKRDFPDLAPVRGAIVTDRERPDMVELTDEHNMLYFVV